MWLQMRSAWFLGESLVETVKYANHLLHNRILTQQSLNKTQFSQNTDDLQLLLRKTYEGFKNATILELNLQCCNQPRFCSIINDMFLQKYKACQIALIVLVVVTACQTICHNKIIMIEHCISCRSIFITKQTFFILILPKEFGIWLEQMA